MIAGRGFLSFVTNSYVRSQREKLLVCPETPLSRGAAVSSLYPLPRQYNEDGLVMNDGR